MTRRINAADIAAADDLPREDVEVPEWGGTVTVRGLSLGERMALARLYTDAPDTVVFRTVATALLGADGEQMFPDIDEAAQMLAQRRADPVQRLAAVIQRLSGFSDEADPDATEKN